MAKATPSKSSKTKSVAIPQNFAPLGRWAKGYFVDLNDRSVHSIHMGGELRALTPYMGRFKLGAEACKGWVPREVIAKAKRTASTPAFARV